MYKSPIEVLYEGAEMQYENGVISAVQKYGVDVDKDELVRALQYDREQYEKGYADGRACARWIPCEEEFPPPNTAVLAYAPRFRNIWAVYYDSICGWMVWSPVGNVHFPGGQGEIIAWMPLPEPYKGEEG